MFGQHPSPLLSKELWIIHTQLNSGVLSVLLQELPMRDMHMAFALASFG
jgi:hypothetical protein